MDSKSIGEMALYFFIIFALVSLFSYRRTRKEEDAIAKSIEEEFHPRIGSTTFVVDPKEEQGYYISQGHDVDSSFYEVRQYQCDKEISKHNDQCDKEICKHNVTPAEWDLPWLPGIDREFALVLTSDFSGEQYSSYWQTIFALDCKHYLPSIHKIEKVTGFMGTYCFICRGHSDVVKIVNRGSIFPTEGDSIKTIEDWTRAVEAARSDG
jgi:hypothetical protein